MSSHRGKLQIDQENQHQNTHSKMELRASLNNENTPSAIKRPLSAKGGSNDKRMRVPLRGKDQNQSLPFLQRSKSSIVSTAEDKSLKVGPRLTGQPSLGRSNSSLGLMGRQPPSNGVRNVRNSNPQRNELFPSADAQRAKELVPLFSSDSPKKSASSITLAPLPTRLGETQSEFTAKLHVSNLPENVSPKIDPEKKASNMIDLEDIIEQLAKDEDSISRVPDSIKPMSDDLPYGLSLEELEAPFLYDEPSTRKKRHFPLDPFSAELDEETARSSNERLFNELSSSKEPLGLEDSDLEKLLEF